MVETLLSISEALLHGEAVTDMSHKIKKGDPVKQFIRVVGFDFKGGFYTCDAPVIMRWTGQRWQE